MKFFDQKIVYKTSVLVLLLLIFGSCAKQGNLSGGPKDISPPLMDTILSTKNYRTNFYPTLIELYFDEWIQLKNQSQILVSPPLKFNPQIKSKGKNISIELDKRELLRDSTTYTINFGNSIVDYTESNPVENFSFVFSTGSIIDSLSLKGKVIDAYTKKTVQNALVMLYDDFSDSIVYKEQPYYFTKTDKNGLFRINNVRQGIFKCFALLDADYNFLYNQDNEQIGFMDTLVHVLPDSLSKSLLIELFLPYPQAKIMEASIPLAGKVKLLFNRQVDSVSITDSNIGIFHQETMVDSVFLWFEDTIEETDTVFLALNFFGKKDSLKIKSKPNKMGPLRISATKLHGTKLFPGEKLVLVFNQLVKEIDSSLFKIKVIHPIPVVDSTNQLPRDAVLANIAIGIVKDTFNLRSLILNFDREESRDYELRILPGGVGGFYQNTNDTLLISFKTEQKENLGNIICKFDSLNKNSQYVIQLIKNKKTIKSLILEGIDEKEILFDFIVPGKYKLVVIEDSNKNGKWDPGDYLQHRQSEKILELGLEELRKNWDIQTTIKWDSK